MCASMSHRGTGNRITRLKRPPTPRLLLSAVALQSLASVLKNFAPTITLAPHTDCSSIHMWMWMRKPETQMTLLIVDDNPVDTIIIQPGSGVRFQKRKSSSPTIRSA